MNLIWKYNEYHFLSYDLLNVLLSPSKFVDFNENLHCCHGRYHDVTCSHRKFDVTCKNNIIYDMKLSTEWQWRHLINGNQYR